jgi:hypothetical protein
MRMLTTLTVFTFAALTLGVIAAEAQTPSQPACGVETWSTDKMMYVTTPCAHDQLQQQTGQAQKPAASNAKCGVETWSTDKMTYESTPCSHSTTYENPGSAQQ